MAASASKVAGRIESASDKSIKRWGQSDEPFTIRDIQFDDPRIVILLLASFAIFAEFFWIFSIFYLRKRPFPRAVKLRHTFVYSSLAPVLATNDKQCACIPFTFCKNGRETAAGLNRADQP